MAGIDDFLKAKPKKTDTPTPKVEEAPKGVDQFLKPRNAVPNDAEARALVESQPYGTSQYDPWYERTGRGIQDAIEQAGSTFSFGGTTKLMDMLGYKGTENLEGARERSPVATKVGEAAAMGAQAAAVSAALPGLAPALGRNTYGATMANNAIAEGTVSAAQDVAQGEVPDPLRTGGAAAMGGLGGAAIMGLSRAISPGARVRATGQDLTQADKVNAFEMAQRSRELGIPLRNDEAISAVAPGRAAETEAFMNRNSSSPRGNVVARNFEAQRKDGIEAAGRNIADQIGNGIDPYDVSRAAQSEMDSLRALVRESADPYYRAADPAPLPRRATIPTAAEREAMGRVSADEVLQEYLRTTTGTDSPNTVAARDAQMKAARDISTGSSAAARPDTLRGSIFGETAGDLENFIASNNPDYATARSISEQGNNMVDRVDAGPLGVLARSPNSAAQGDALFGVTNAADAARAENAARRLPNDVARGVLHNRFDSSISVTPDNPAGFAGALPTEYSRRVAGAITGPLAPDIGMTMEVGRAMRPTPVLGGNGDNAGPVGAAYQAARDYGRGGVTDRMLDPDWIMRMGIKGPVQKGFEGAAMGTGATAAASQGEGREHRRRKPRN